jgi:EmrB/QacA subfamily drug resistance transporter
MRRWQALVALATAQFLMVLDTSVMNVSISQLVEDFDTEVTAIQATITIYTLVMAAFMVTGGKLGDMWGRRRAFTIGLIVYGCGSAVTAVAPTLGVLVIGWSIIEGLGAALVLPALAALVAGNYAGKERVVAFGVIGGVSGAGIAVGPLLGGWVTTYLTWRLVFAGEVVVVLLILAMVRWIRDSPPGRRPSLDWVGGVLSIAGLALIVLGVLQSGTWGWLSPRNSPITPFGFALTPFVIAAGVVALVLLRDWESSQESRGKDVLIRFRVFRIPQLRAGLIMLLGQNTVMLGVFFAIPLYLQIVQGFDAFQTGLRLLPVSLTMVLAAMSGPVLSRLASPRRIVQAGVATLLLAILWLLTAIRPTIDDTSFALAMAVMGVGMGLMASQLGNVVQSSVGDEERGEVGGLQYTAQNLGGSLGTALIGSILVGALAASLTSQIESDPRISATTNQQVGIRLEAGISFLPTSGVDAALARAEVPEAEAAALVDQYAEAQLKGLKAGLLAAAAIALVSLAFTRHLPGERLGTPRSRRGRSQKPSSNVVRSG